MDDRRGDVNATRDVGRAFHILVPQVMDTLYQVYVAEDDRETLDAINQFCIGIYNAAIRYDKSSIDLIAQLKDYVSEDERKSELYSAYAICWHQSLLTYLLVTFPVIFGLAEYDTEGMSEYGMALNVMSMVSAGGVRKAVGQALQREGLIPAAVKANSLAKSAELFIRLIEEEREFRRKEADFDEFPE